MTKKPKNTNKKQPAKENLEKKFGWEFAQSENSHHDESHYEEFLKDSYNYNDKLYEIHKEEFTPKKIVVDSFEEELIEAAKRALDR